MSMLFALLLCLPALILGQDIDALAIASFKRVDSNDDNRVSKSEIDNYFDNYDQNNDGHVSRPEYSHYVDQNYPDQTTNTVIRGLFSALDTDGNNILNNVDYNKIFADADANNNGEINQEEYIR
ncbi:calmodulin, striated muscle-like [Physella acuta]|uniref:calmodulin, striated muscle-like n=1 Tax=Physella acuta TaxID=109671 RepID=UPI0027DB9BF5|nr:calmodulin, striated muscle-like [Physella acuta]